MEHLEEEVAKLTCSHTFHTQCIKLLHGTTCPICRAPIESPAIKEEEIVQMHKRQRDDMEEASRNQIVDVMAEHYVAPGSEKFEQALGVLLQHMSVMQLVKANIHSLVRDFHEILHTDGVLSYISDCSSVNHFLEECVHLLERNPKMDDPPDADILEWFSAHLFLPDVNNSLHNVAHTMFLGVDCNTLHTHHFFARKVALGRSLLVSALKQAPNKRRRTMTSQV